MIAPRPSFSSIAVGLGLVLGLGLGLGPGGCTTTSETCQTLCSKLEACGMLPGPLGDAQPDRSPAQDCEARCSISSNNVELGLCFDARDISEQNAWCDGGVCAEAASCLRSTLDDDYVLGSGTVRIGASSEVLGIDARCPTEQTAAALDDVVDQCAAAPFLEAEGIINGLAGDVFVELISDELPSISVSDGPCNTQIGRPLHVHNVPVGTYRAQVRVFAAASSNCSLFQGPLVNVAAGQTLEAVYPSDWDAQEVTLCPEAEPSRCQDGIDNDDDSLIDCEDSDCEASGVCDDGVVDSNGDDDGGGSSSGG